MPRISDNPSITVAAHRMEHGVLTAVEESLVTEEPLEIQLAYGPTGERKVKSISVTMRTPGADSELAAGFLLTEGVVCDANDIAEVTTVSSLENTIRVELAPDVAVNMASLERNFYTTSSCGICGKASLLALQTVSPPRHSSHFKIDATLLYTLPAKLREAQGIFAQTGGLHAAGLFDAAGKLHSIREDVGRHNAVDKLLGAEFLADRTPLRDRMLLLSGRASFELLQKAVMAGLPMVASVGAPSSLALSIAREFDICLVGFLRDQRFNIYHGNCVATD
ncbi:MAG TPA: formate dehydrogenase accessory sulfurtransferase FdhD [Acidobacteriaceae bacterium]